MLCRRRNRRTHGFEGVAAQLAKNLKLVMSLSGGTLLTDGAPITMYVFRVELGAEYIT